MRFLMGLFDPKVPNYYRNISTTEVGMPASQQVSLEAARATMTLLKNDGNTLPFRTGLKVAVLGASSNSSGDLLGNYIGPICPSGKYECVPTIFEMIGSIGGGQTTLVDDPSKVDDAVQAAKDADVVVLVISNANDGGGEGDDRETIGLEASQETFAQAVLKVRLGETRRSVAGDVEGGQREDERRGFDCDMAGPCILLEPVSLLSLVLTLSQRYLFFFSSVIVLFLFLSFPLLAPALSLSLSVLFLFSG